MTIVNDSDSLVIFNGVQVTKYMVDYHNQNIAKIIESGIQINDPFQISLNILNLWSIKIPSVKFPIYAVISKIDEFGVHFSTYNDLESDKSLHDLTFHPSQYVIFWETSVPSAHFFTKLSDSKLSEYIGVQARGAAYSGWPYSDHHTGALLEEKIRGKTTINFSVAELREAMIEGMRSRDRITWFSWVNGMEWLKDKMDTEPRKFTFLHMIFRSGFTFNSTYPGRCDDPLVIEQEWKRRETAIFEMFNDRKDMSYG